MNLSTRDLAAVWVTLKGETFGASGTLAGEVETVLRLGNEKHADTDERTVFTHCRKAMQHLQTEGTDTETGCSHRAHGIARLMLAIATVCRKEG